MGCAWTLCSALDVGPMNGRRTSSHGSGPPSAPSAAPRGAPPGLIIGARRRRPLPSAVMDLRLERGLDHDAVRDVHRRAFGDEGAVVAELVDGLRRADAGALGLVAEDGGRIAGHVMFTRSLLDAPR